SRPAGYRFAGLGSFRGANRSMPEEHNRVLTDHVAELLFCPTQKAADNLSREGIDRGVHLVGDVMYDAVLHNVGVAERRSQVLSQLGLTAGTYALATVHRPRNTNDRLRLRSILAALETLDRPVVLPAHPRTREAIESLNYRPKPSVKIIKPVGYLDMLLLEQQAQLILTDSGGVQKEAYFFGVPCLTLREETEWVETVERGWNRLVGADFQGIVESALDFRPTGTRPPVFGDGHASERIAGVLVEGRQAGRSEA
ncbi:MAG: UDP-N-acetyl glucosamine 2-epimerase, partial [bacterium]